jgi:sugar-specific transcriptional regulator TrmB
MAASDPTSVLSSLGFSAIESAAYASLLGSWPATGYRVAKAIGKPVANTYKALEGLVEKGAVVLDEGETRLWRAVAPGELLRRMERSYAERCATAEQALRSLHQESGDDRVYALKSREQVFERIRQMLAASEMVVMVDGFPGVFPDILADLAATAARGVEMCVLAYEPIEIPRARVTIASEGTPVDEWYSQQISVAVDGREYLRAAFDWETGEVLQALWTGSRFLATSEHDDLICQWFTKAVERHIDQQDSIERVKASFDSLRPLFTRKTPGYRELTTQRSAGALSTGRASENRP